jgi:hypothetical protein
MKNLILPILTALPLLGFSQLPVKAPIVPWQPKIGDVIFTPPTSVSEVFWTWFENPDVCTVTVPDYEDAPKQDRLLMDNAVIGPMTFKAMPCEDPCETCDFYWECINCEQDYGFPFLLKGKFTKKYKRA